MGENIYTQSSLQGISLQNIQRAYAAQLRKNPIKKWSEDIDISAMKTNRWLKST